MMEINRVTVDDARELLEIYAPYVMETAISLEYEVP
jgi:phosphinothricin acetyltransferase